MKRAAATCPGKLIISGEHAAVYGRPALIMAVNHFATVHLHAADDGVFRFQVPAFGRQLKYSADQLAALERRLEDRYQSFLDGDLPIGEVLRKPEELIPFAYWRVAQGAMPVDGMELEVDVDLPLGSGMGSSAAVALATIQAAVAFWEMNWSAEELYAAAMTCERLRHGEPSGIDPYTCLYGGFVRFREGEFAPLDLPAPQMYVVQTGSPECGTGDCVATVREEFGDSDIWDEFAAATEAVEAALEQDDTRILRQAIRENHRLLTRIGVVPGKVQDFVAHIEAAGGAAKICGAGAVRGETAGLVMVLADEQPAELCRRHGYDLLSVEGDPHGCRVLDGDDAG